MVPPQPQPLSLTLTNRVWRPAARVLSSPAAIFLVALVARLKVLRDLLPAHAWDYFYRYYESAHIAWALSSGLGYSSPWPHTPIAPTAQQPPVYPLLLAGIFKLAGPYSYLSLWIAAGLNATFSALTAVLILRIGRRDFGAIPGTLAAWVWSCWLYEAAVSVRLWESSLSALLVTIGLLALPRLVETLRPWVWLLFGAFVALAALTNASLLSVFPCFWAWLWVSYRRRGLSCAKPLWASLGMCLLVLLPWTIRNYTVFHRLIPIRDNFGLELWLGNHEGVSRLFDNDFPVLDPSEYNRLGEIGFMEAKRQIALQFIRHNPEQFLYLSLRRGYRYWTAPHVPVWASISVLAWLGMALMVRRRGLDAVPYAIVLLAFPLVYYITHTVSSYRHPMEPVMFLFAAYAVVAIAEAGGRWVLRRT